MYCPWLDLFFRSVWVCSREAIRKLIAWIVILISEILQRRTSTKKRPWSVYFSMVGRREDNFSPFEKIYTSTYIHFIFSGCVPKLFAFATAQISKTKTCCNVRLYLTVLHCMFNSPAQDPLLLGRCHLDKSRCQHHLHPKCYRSPGRIHPRPRWILFFCPSHCRHRCGKICAPIVQFFVLYIISFSTTKHAKKKKKEKRNKTSVDKKACTKLTATVQAHKRRQINKPYRLRKHFITLTITTFNGWINQVLSR